MSFPNTYTEVAEMALRNLLFTPTTRDIARKAGLRLGGARGGEGARLWGNFSYVTEAITDAGYTAPYPAGLEPAFLTLGGIEPMRKLMDAKGVSQARLVANVTAAGKAGSTLFVEVEGGGGERGFQVSPPSVPLDEAGLQVSSWREFFEVASFAGEASTPEYLRWVISNPGGAATGTFSVGLCQLQTK